MSRPLWAVGTRLLLPSLAFAAVLATGMTAACRSGADAADRPDQPAVTVRAENIAVLEERELAAGPLLSGSLVPDRQATLRAEVAGVVLAAAVEAGEQVGKGQLLVRLDDAAITEAVRSAESARRTAAEALEVAQRDAERTVRLAAVGAVADRDVERSRWAVTSAEGQLSDAEARLATARKQLAKTEVRSPFAGVVSERPVRAGDVVQTGNPLVTVVDLRSLRLEASVPASALGALAAGTPVRFQVTGFEQRQISGEVTRVNPVVDQTTGQIRVVVAIPNVEGPLVGGLFAQGRAATERRIVLALPEEAIDRLTATPSVRRIRGGVVELVVVSLGLRDEALDLVEVTAGLAPGDTVLVRGGQDIVPGTRVVLAVE